MTREALVTYFQKVRKTSEDICKPLEIEDYVIQPVEDVSPPKWHIAHTTWFFEHLILNEFVNKYKPVNPYYYYLFNSYYHSMGERWDRPERGNLSRPTVAQVYQYRKEIDSRIVDLIIQIPEGRYNELLSMMVLGCHHEQQHQELLLMDIKYILSINPINTKYAYPYSSTESNKPVKLEIVDIQGGLYEIGYKGDNFCYDNETPVHSVYVHDFKIHNRLVTNGEFLEFIEDNGYNDYQHWLSDGWDIIQKRNWKAPLYWRQKDGEWQEFSLAGWQALNPDRPVSHISYYEAEAFASWSGKRLPREEEWEVASNLHPDDPATVNIFDKAHLQPLEASSDGAPLTQMIGDLWEWTNSSYLPYPGYKHDEGALGEYNGKFMVDQMVLRGGSCATSANHIRNTYRNFFQTDKRWQFSGMRLVEDI